MLATETETSLTMYVYYKIPAEQRQRYLLAMNELKNSIGALYPALTISQQRKPEMDAENRELWMEIYAGITSDALEKFSSDLNKLAEKNCLPKERRNEIFIPL